NTEAQRNGDAQRHTGQCQPACYAGRPVEPRLWASVSSFLRVWPLTPSALLSRACYTEVKTALVSARHDEAPPRDQLGHASTVRTASGSGEPDGQAPRAARVGVVRRVLRAAIAAIQPGSRSRRAAAV